MTRVVFHGGRLFDGTGVTDGDVLIEGGRIVEVGQAEDLGQRYQARETIDCRGKAVLPGLIDAHTHAVDGSLAQALAFGVTTELDMFSLPSNLARQRRLAAERDEAIVVCVLADAGWKYLSADFWERPADAAGAAMEDRLWW